MYRIYEFFLFRIYPHVGVGLMYLIHNVFFFRLFVLLFQLIRLVASSAPWNKLIKNKYQIN